MKGLMDTGASISCIGGDLAREIFDKNIKFKQMSSNVRTADGKSQTISGKLCLEVTYGGFTRLLTFFLVPTLIHSLYLGIDFWTEFDMLPSGLTTQDGLSSISGYEKKLTKIVSQRKLSTEQQGLLEKAI